ncbi:unnamed protein product, partial [Mesorhabditis spiculigera]
MPLRTLNREKIILRRRIIAEFCEHAEIYEGRLQGAPIACKLIDGEELEIAGYERLKNEVNILEVEWLRRLVHPYILRLHSSTVAGPYLCLTTDLADMRAATNVIKDYYPLGLPEPALRIILKQLFKALTYMHARNVVHRGIRACHILIDSKSGVKLTGFRHSVHLKHTAKNRPDYDAVTHAYDAQLENCLLWLAPEIISQDIDGYGLASDIYSVGITLCEMANGAGPFTEMDPFTLLAEKTGGTVPCLLDSITGEACNVVERTAHYNRTFTKDLHWLVASCVALDPADRPTAQYFLEKSSLRKAKSRHLRKALERVQLETQKPDEDIADHFVDLTGCEDLEWLETNAHGNKMMIDGNPT